MGIPSYFSHLVRKHKACIKEIASDTIDNLYIDANSIIYDSLHRLQSDDEIPSDEVLIQSVYTKICEYITTISPTRL